jgi:small conductance mechanosensitive channel
VIYHLTNNDFISRSADTLISKSFNIALIIALSFLARYVLRRAIHRLVEGAVTTRMPRLVVRVPRLRLNRPNGAAAATRQGPVALPPTPRRAQRARTIGSVLRSLSSVVVLVIGSIMVLAEFGRDRRRRGRLRRAEPRARLPLRDVHAARGPVRSR